jgi:hypothetical protein
MQLQLARALPQVLTAECDDATSDLIDSSAYRLNPDGTMTVPDSPGFGLALRDDVFRDRYARDAWTVGS